MIHLVNGETVTCGSRILRVGMPVKPSILSFSDYCGLYGCIICIKTESDKKHGKPGPEVYCKFDIPHSPIVRERVFKQFIGQYTDIFDVVRDWIHMQPDDLIPTVQFSHVVRHNASGREYIVYLDGMCRETAISFDLEYRWPYNEFKASVVNVPLEESGAEIIIDNLLKSKNYLYHDLAYQLKNELWALQNACHYNPPLIA